MKLLASSASREIVMLLKLKQVAAIGVGPGRLLVST